ncbi:MAG: GGDEF domain-containing protein [Myxococcales bacterium]|nr:GGDEF domain-containing protein [Myxococcales bacterium]
MSDERHKRPKRPTGESFEDPTETLAGDEIASGLVSKRQQAYLIVVSGGRVGEMVRVDERLVIGRAIDVDFRVDDAGVSKRHVEICKTDTGMEVRDLGSRNGTFLNGERLERQQLRDGDKIYFGSTTILKFSLADELDESFQKHMFDAALRDGLTSLFNRRYLEDQLEVEVSYALRHVIPLSLVMIDVDHFKDVNDTYGHPVGDRVLRAIADCLRGAIRREDLATRYGGEEFALVCRATPAEVATMVADRIRSTLARGPLLPDIPELHLTVSAGVAALPGHELRSADELVAAADAALYRAKDAGRDCVRCHGVDDKG